MKIYDEEKHLNITNKVVAHSPIVMKNSKLCVFDKAKASEDDLDLYTLFSILVSSGWNLNDDVFDTKELWASRSTPVDKPFNVAHSPRNIIGHIIDCYGVDDDYKRIEDEPDDEDIMHLLVKAVIYKHIKSLDPELEEEISKLIEEIENGEWYVSMECLFQNFDYAIVHPVYGNAYIKRDETSAFLTPHLRSYGGTGYYNGLKIGRALRGLTFSGNGLVKNPANKRSIILSDVESFSGSYASLDKLLQEKKMPETKDFEAQYNEILAKYNEAVAQVEELQKEISNLKESQTNKDSLIENLQTENASHVAKIEELTKSVETSTAQVEKIGVLEGELSVANEKISQLEVAKLNADRIASLVDIGVDKAEATELVKRFNGVSDEQFVEVMKLQEQIIKASKVEVKTEVETTEAEVETEDVDETGEEAVASTDIENPEEDKTDVALATDEGQQDIMTKVYKDIANYFDNVFKK